MRPLFLDFETYYDDAYTLKKITPIEYVLDPRFEALGCGFIDQQGNREWVDGPWLPQKFATVDWQNTFAVSHNSLFDMLILAARYGVFPRMYGCTLSMVRNWLSASLSSFSLKSVCEHYGMPAKWDTATRMKGVSYAALVAMPALHQETAAYGVDDAAKCREIFMRMMMSGFPPRELKVIDLLIRMVTKPQLEFDRDLLALHLAEVKAHKQALLEAAQLTDGSLQANIEAKASLMSDERLAGLLSQAGVIPPKKISKKTGEEVYAFAKTDREFTALLDSPNQQVQTLVAARLGHKTTLEESRTERLLAISNFTLAAPVPLKYSGAHTHRFSGDWKINLQNLGRKSTLRKAIKAPKGKKVVAVDASQIEARFNATLSQQWDLVEQFRAGEDVYANFAEVIYQYAISKSTHPTERFVGKTGILSLGYGSSAIVFQQMVRVQGNVYLRLEEASQIVALYRQRYRQIVLNWDHAEKVVLPMLAGLEPVIGAVMPDLNTAGWRAWGPVGIDSFSLLLPSANRLRYRDLHQEIEGNRRVWKFMRGTHTHYVYGAKIVENVIQALAFIHIIEVALRVYDMTQGLLWPAHQVHDELLYVVDDHLAEMVRDLVVREMAKAPDWMPLAPLAAEGNIGQSYGETK